MRVFLVAPVDPFGSRPGGTRSYVTGLCRGLRRIGLSVTLVGYGPAAKQVDSEFVTVSTKAVRSNYEYHRRLHSWVNSARLENGDIVDAQRPDFLIPFLALSERIRLVCTLHGDPLFALRQRRYFGSLLYRRAETKGLRASNRVISVSKTALDRYTSKYPFLGDKATVVPIGVDLTAFAPMDRQLERKRLGIPDRPTVLYAGRLDPEKRVHVLFDAVAMMDNPPSLIIAGSGVENHALKERSRENGAHFLGSVSHEEMPRVIAAADALVLPSAYEGMPTIALEALACGVPVVTTRVGDLPWLISPGKTGFFFDGSPASLQGVLEDHLGDMDKLRTECVRAAKPFGWESVSEQVAEVLLATS